MRLGYDDDTQAEECALAIQEAGAGELVVHGRTRAQGYKPPAFWDRIADVRRALAIPVIANGEIWTVEDARRCRLESGCADLMIGRGAVQDPGLALAIAADELASGPGAAGESTGLGWSQCVPLLLGFIDLVEARIERRAQAGRVKQWLFYLRHRHEEAARLYADLRRVEDLEVMRVGVRASLGQGARVEVDSGLGAGPDTGPAMAGGIETACA